ncbi:VCBS repeat-containing protein [bacterium]|nr:VCBS repeat-containing protein [bacterium]
MLNRLHLIYTLIFSFHFNVVASQTNQYTSNPKKIAISVLPAGMHDHFMVADLNMDGAQDFLFRSNESLWAYDHNGTLLWAADIALAPELNGSTMAAGDLGHDGNMEVLVLNNNNQVVVFNGTTGNEIQRFNIDVGIDQRAAYLQLVNLQGNGMQDLIVQTNDVKVEHLGVEYYINRSLIAYELDTQTVLWRVDQDNTGSDGQSWYEGYWGQAHGAFFAADIDGDGLDEVVGSNWIDHDGTVHDIGYPMDWIQASGTYMDHLDAISVGDFCPDLPGLEWAMTEEDHEGLPAGSINNWHTALLSGTSIEWRVETLLFADGRDREPQNLAVGNFSNNYTDVEFWNRSKTNESAGVWQHPWIYDNSGRPIGDYDVQNGLPANFGDYPEKGIEMIWTIDWDGSDVEYIAAQARHAVTVAHVGVFNALTGEAVWTSLSESVNIYANNIYVADVSGDSREEIIFIDGSDNTIKVFHNDEQFTDTNPDKWDDPLYKRLKQNWSYYSPGSYTARIPVTLTIIADAALSSGSAEAYISKRSPFFQASRIVQIIPANVIDWVLIEILSGNFEHIVLQQSAFLRADGHIVNEKGREFIDAFVEKQNEYHIKISYSNGSTILTGDAQDFSSGSVQYNFAQTSVNPECSETHHYNDQINLEQSHPNPMHSYTELTFHVRNQQYVELSVYNLMGQEVCQLINGNMQAGSHQITWDGRDMAGHNLPGGIYFIVLNHGAATQKILLIR